MAGYGIRFMLDCIIVNFRLHQSLLLAVMRESISIAPWLTSIHTLTGMMILHTFQNMRLSPSTRNIQKQIC